MHVSAASGLSPTHRNPMTPARPVAAAAREPWSRAHLMAVAALTLLGAVGAAVFGSQLPMAGVVADAARSALTDTSVLPLHVVLTLCSGALLFGLAKRYPTVVLKRTAFTLVAFAVCTQALRVGAQDAAAPAAPVIDNTKVALDTIWTLITGFMVFFMNLGFALVESGLCRAKNATNILAKNYIVFCVSSIAFLVLGFGLMFGDGSPYVGMQGLFFVGGADNSPFTGKDYQGVYSALNWTGTPLWTKFFFQLVFAGTAGTIVSGAVAERIKFSAFMLFSFVMIGLIYPIAGHWIWGGGWLAQKGMFDFAGSTVVHSIGGWAALAGVWILGPRIGRYKDGKVTPIPGHSMTSATIGVFVLWFGWFGFNPGSTMAADWASIGHIAVTTNTAAAAASLSALLTIWKIGGKPDLSMTLNGGLAGLVAITAPCAFVGMGTALLIGLIAGVLVVFAVLFFDKMKLDDPVGATSVHLVNGVFGTLCVGLFADPTVCPAAAAVKAGLFMGGGTAQLIPQIMGIVAVGAFVFIAASATWFLLKATIGIRVSAEEETEGLDYGEHGNAAYPDFHPSAEA
jgi:ammonium transporter, Amt family